MPTIEDMKGFAYPTPQGKASVVGDLPWHFGTEHLCVAYRTSPKALAAYLPEPLAPSDPPDLVIVDFGKWYCLWDQLDSGTFPLGSGGTHQPGNPGHPPARRRGLSRINRHQAIPMV